MTDQLSPEGYEQTKEKLAKLEQRLERLVQRADLNQQHKAATRRSYEQMIAQYRREIKLYEATHAQTIARP